MYFPLVSGSVIQYESIVEEVALMTTIMTITLVIVCIALITIVLLQQGSGQGMSGSLSGGAEQLFGKQKARGIDLFLQRAMVVLSILFFALTLGMAYLS